MVLRTLIRPLTIAALSAACLLGPQMNAQTPTHPKVFLANDGGVDNATMQRAYAGISTALEAKDGYTLVKTPAEADVIVSLRCEDRPVTNHDITQFNHTVTLSIVDPASHQTTWTVQERGPYPAFQLSDGHIWGKNFTKVANKLADDLQHAISNGNVTIASR